MKKRLITAVLITASIISVLLLCFSCDKKPALPSTTIIQIQAPNTDGQPGTQLVFNYEVSFKPIVEFQGEAFPVKILSLASVVSWVGNPRMVDRDDYIGDDIGDFGVALSLMGSSDNEKIPVIVEIQGDRFIKKSRLEAVVSPNKEIEIFPRITYDYNALERLVQPASENVYFRLFYGSVLLLEKTEVIRFHSVNEVPLAEVDRRDDESIIDHRFFFAAYVNEDDPLIDKILEEALQIGMAEKLGFGNSFSFSGYQIKDQDGDSSLSVDLQVLAIWSVFLKHNIKYSNITTTSTANAKILTQYVRTLGESFGNSQANCVDGSVLFASILRKIGIEPYLILVPGHMFVAYLRNEEPEVYGFLETTMLGNVNISKYTKDESLFGKLKKWTGVGSTQSQATLVSFLSALEVGQKNADEAMDNLMDDNNDQYRVISISACRSIGIMPITRY